jgi:hypothetical protein
VHHVTRTVQQWIDQGLPPGTYDALLGLPASRLWSLLLEVAESRAATRRTGDLAGQWDRDRFVRPSAVDQRALIVVDRHLLDAAAAFDSIELSPIAPLGVCSLMGFTSQNKVLSTLRGTEVVSDPTNVMALECADRLRQDPATVVRLATSHRCVRAQPIPPQRGFAAHFRMFCLVSAGIEQQNHAFVVEAFTEHMATMLRGLDRLEHEGFMFPERRITIMATPDRAALGDRIAAALAPAAVGRSLLEHPYYSGGLRFQISARSTEGMHVPLIDGGSFDWVARLTSNRRAVYVASAIGSQLAAQLYRLP